MMPNLWAQDFKGLLLSKRMSYSIVIMTIFSLVIAIIIRFAPEGLRNALGLAAPGSAGVFESLWSEDILDKLLLLIFISFGSYAICDLEDEKMMGLLLSRAQSRLVTITRRLTVSLVSMILIFIAGSIVAGAIGIAIAGEMDFPLFLLHQILVLPMILFVFSLTFLLSIPLRLTASTVIASFGITLALSFLYTFLLMSGDAEPSIFNPLALGYRIIAGLPLEGAAGVALSISGVMLVGGAIWFTKKDL